jgi:hypothetical protein
MRVINVLAAVAAISLAGGAAAAKDKPAENGAKKICRTVMPAVGRIPAKKDCRSQAEWEAMSAESQRNAARAVDSARGGN